MIRYPRDVRLRTDGLHWRVEVRNSVIDWPWFWRRRDDWRACNLMPFLPYTFATLDEEVARAACARIERFEQAMAAGYRTVWKGTAS